MARAVTLTLFVVFLSYTYAHSHDHAHSHEPAHAKYGREINEKAAKEAELGEDSAAHGHSHGAGGCPHAHSHGAGHGHSHEDHHEHEHEHGHSHDHHEHETKDVHGHTHHNIYTQRCFWPRLSMLLFLQMAYVSAISKARSPKRRPFGVIKALTILAKNSCNRYYARSGVNPHLWSYAIGATLVISAFPCFLLYFIPIQDNSSSNEKWLKVLLAFGSGGLLGDAFLHLIPHAMPADSGSHSHSHSHSHEGGHGHSHGDMHVGGWVLAGIIAFLMVEKVVRIIRGEDGHGHSHSHTHHKKAKNSDDESDDETKEKSDDSKEKLISSPAKEQKQEGIKVAAYLNLVADFAHNFTDGLAIGASFIAGTTIGVVTMITVLVHEVPHEIGDFAILIQSGYSKRKAMAIQLVTALGALSGCAISLWVADPSALADAAASSWILPFTAGGFIYIATVSVIPELLENSSTAQSIGEILALLSGIFMMYLISMYE